MKKIIYPVCFLFSLLLGACAEQEPIYSKKVSVRMMIPQSFTTRIVDEDNLASEQIINNISIFFTEPSSLTVTDKYIHTGFTLSGDYQLITLPLEATVLQTKNIYAVANFDDIQALEAVTSVNDLVELYTPVVDKTNNLNPLDGFCMSGFLLNFDFTTGGDVIATVPLERTCAKIRVRMSFPETAELSIDNSFLVQRAASHTFVLENPTAVLTVNEYFNFAAPLPLVRNSANEYMNIAYVYEAQQKPQITFYTHLNNSVEVQEFTADLPLPDRNYLYDIEVVIYQEEETVARSVNREYSVRTEITTYNDKGLWIESKTEQHPLR